MYNYIQQKLFPVYSLHLNILFTFLTFIEMHFILIQTTFVQNKLLVIQLFNAKIRDLVFQFSLDYFYNMYLIILSNLI